MNEPAASGVSGAADLNTIPMSIIDCIEVLEDGTFLDDKKAAAVSHR